MTVERKVECPEEGNPKEFVRGKYVNAQGGKKDGCSRRIDPY